MRKFIIIIFIVLVKPYIKTYIFGQHKEEIDNMFWLASELFTQHWILGSNAHWTCVQMTFSHHSTA